MYSLIAVVLSLKNFGFRFPSGDSGRAVSGGNCLAAGVCDGRTLGHCYICVPGSSNMGLGALEYVS